MKREILSTLHNMYSRLYGFFSIGMIETLNLVSINTIVITTLQLIIAILTIVKLFYELKNKNYGSFNSNNINKSKKEK